VGRLGKQTTDNIMSSLEKDIKALNSK
jgi:hypothetical protein